MLTLEKIFDTLEPTLEPTQDMYDDYEFVNRSQYGALPSKTTLNQLSLPVTTIIIGRTKSRSCATYVRKDQLT